jgi:hypothetical protein
MQNEFNCLILTDTGCKKENNPVHKIVEFYNENIVDGAFEFIFFAIKTEETIKKDDVFAYFHKKIARDPGQRPKSGPAAAPKPLAKQPSRDPNLRRGQLVAPAAPVAATPKAAGRPQTLVPTQPRSFSQSQGRGSIKAQPLGGEQVKTPARSLFHTEKSLATGEEEPEEPAADVGEENQEELEEESTPVLSRVARPATVKPIARPSPVLKTGGGLLKKPVVQPKKTLMGHIVNPKPPPQIDVKPNAKVMAARKVLADKHVGQAGTKKAEVQEHKGPTGVRVPASNFVRNVAEPDEEIPDLAEDDLADVIEEEQQEQQEEQKEQEEQEEEPTPDSPTLDTECEIKEDELEEHLLNHNSPPDEVEDTNFDDLDESAVLNKKGDQDSSEIHAQDYA